MIRLLLREPRGNKKDNKMSKIVGISLALAAALVAIPTLMISASGPWAHQRNVVTDSDDTVLGKVHGTVNGAAPAHQAVGGYHLFGQDGKLIGAAADPSLRLYFKQAGLPE
jgi:hypothetical protein